MSRLSTCSGDLFRQIVRCTCSSRIVNIRFNSRKPRASISYRIYTYHFQCKFLSRCADSQLINSIVIARIPQLIGSNVTCTTALVLSPRGRVPCLLYVPVNTRYIEASVRIYLPMKMIANNLGAGLTKTILFPNDDIPVHHRALS